MFTKVHQLIAILLPTTFLGFSILWWKRKRNKTIDTVGIEVSQNKEVEDHTVEDDIMQIDNSILDYKVGQNTTSEKLNLVPVLDSGNTNKNSQFLVEVSDTPSIKLKREPDESLSDDEFCLEAPVFEEEVCNTEVTENYLAAGDENKPLEDEPLDTLPEDVITNMPTRVKRKRNQSSCCDGDSAIVEDYSSDNVSTTESDVTPKSPENTELLDSMIQALEEYPLSRDVTDSPFKDAKSRDWYTSSTDEKGKLPWHAYPVPSLESNDISDILKESDVLSLKDLGDAIDSGEYFQKTQQEKSKQQHEKSKSSPKTSPKKVKSKAKKSDSKRSTPKSPMKPSPLTNLSFTHKKKGFSKKLKDKNLKSEPKRSDLDQSWRKRESKKEVVNDIHETMDFQFPEAKCGRLIGKAGKNVTEIKQKTGATVCIESEYYGENQVVSITGLTSQIRRAEKIIIDRFGKEFVQIDYPATPPSVVNEVLDKEVDVIVTAIDDCGHFFVQMFKPDVDELICKLQTDLAKCYSVPRRKYIFNINEKPTQNEICIGLIDNTWCRLRVEKAHDDLNVGVSFVDYGGNLTVPVAALLKAR